TPLTFAGDSGESFERRLGEQTNVKGGAEGGLTEGNIGVVADGEDTLNIQLAENIDLGEDGSLTINETLIDGNQITTNNVTVNETLTVEGDTFLNENLTVAGSTTINENLTVEGTTQLGDNFFVNNEGNVTYDGDITENNHITNKQYVDNSVTELGDTPLTFGANEGDDSERRLGDRLDIVGEEDAEGDSNIITKLTDEETLELALNDDLKIGNSITVGDTFIDGDRITANNLTVSGETNLANTLQVTEGAINVAENTTINMGDNQVTNVAAGTEGDHAVNLDQLNELGDTPLTFAGDSGESFERRLGEQTNVKGGAEGGLTEGNIGVVADGEDTLNIQLAENIDLGEDGSLTINETLIDGDQITTNNVTVNETLTVEGDTFLNENLTVAG
ncbi:hypothetical protein HZS79_16700, partial [Halomonas zhaodongensis]